MELFDPKKLKFEYTKAFKPMGLLSALLIAASIVLLFVPGINYGIDFRGGVEAQVQFQSKDVGIAQIRDALGQKLENVTVIAFDDSQQVNDFMITAQSDSVESLSTVLRSTLAETFGPEGENSWRVVKLDEVGAKVGADFRKSAFLSLLYACLLITLYMYWRFDLRFSPGAIATIFHDLILVSGFLVVVQAEFSTTIVAALLTLAGYSINDTVVIFDRIREMESKYLGRSKEVLVNEAINATLSRTIMTSTTTLVSCLVLYFLGGPTLREFALALTVGVVVGTYSSIFIGAPLYLWADKKFSKSAAQSTSAA